MPAIKLSEPIKQELQKFEAWVRNHTKVASENSIKNYERRLYYFLTWLKEKEINQENIDAYLSERRSKYNDKRRDGIPSPNSIVPMTTAIKHYVRYKGFNEEQIRIKIPAMKPTTIRNKTALSKEEVNRFLETAKEYDIMWYAFYSTMYYGALRVSECASLQPEDINYERQQATVRSGKGGCRRTIPIAPQAIETIKTYLKHRPKPQAGCESFLFLNSNGNKIYESHCKKHIRRIGSIAGIERRIYNHLFRITSITHMSEMMSLKEIQGISGHKCTNVLLGYINPTTERIQKAYMSVFSEPAQAIQTMQPIIEKPQSDTGAMKKAITEKFLRNEIDLQTMNSMLSMYEPQKPIIPDKQKIDVAYL